MRNHIILALLILFPFSMALGQGSVKGVVTDKKTGETLIGVTVLVQGTNQGTITNIKGEYEIDKVNPKSVLAYSYVGYKTVERAVGQQSVINISMESSNTTLDEFVVIGYGTTKKSNVLGAVAKVESKELNAIPVTGVEQTLQGRVSGVQVTQNTGAPGEGVAVRIRGAGSLNSSNTPLYIVDGIPTADALNVLAAADIENITVLKDASASAIYGARANNGVVLITTKKGSKGSMRVTYNGKAGIQAVANLPEMVNTADYIKIYNEAATNDNLSLPSALQRPLITASDSKNFADVNHLEELFKIAPIQSHDISLSGGSDKTTYLFSASYFDQRGIIDGSGYKKGSTRLNVDTEVNSWLKAGMALSAGMARTDIIGSSGDGLGGNGGSIIRYAFFRNPAIPIKDLNGDFVDRPSEYFGNQIYDSWLGDGYNPIGMAEYADNHRDDDIVLGKAYLQAQIVKDLQFTSNFGVDYRNSYSRRFDRTWGTNNRINGKNRLLVGDFRYLNWSNNSVLNYTHRFGDDHNFSAMGGFEAIKNTGREQYNEDSDFPVQDDNLIFIGNGSGDKIASQSQWASTLVSFFGRASYDYKNKYFASATVRRDGSSRFTADNRWGTFYSFSGGWSLDQEAFLQEVKWIERLRLRAGYGAIGNQEIGLYAYSDRISPNYNYPFGNASNSGYIQSALGNEDLKWETSKQFNIGLDVELWEGSFGFSVDYFNKKTEDMLVKASIPPSSGNADAPWINNGSVLNRGVELEAIYHGKAGNFKFDVIGNVTLQHNEVTDLDAPFMDGRVESGVYATRTAVGQPIGAFYLLEMEGIFQNEQEVLLHAFQGNDIKPGDVMYKDQNGDGKIDNQDRVYLGSAIPKVIGGLTLNGQYKQWDLSLFFQGVAGNKIYNQIAQDIEGFYRGFTVTQRYFDDHWTGEGTSNTQPRASWTSKSNNARPSSRFLEDGSYLRLKNIQVGYNFEKSLLKRLGVEKARVYVSASNLFTLTKYSGLDPEMTVSDNSTSEGDRANGIDWGTYPSSRMFLVGFDISI